MENNGKENTPKREVIMLSALDSFIQSEIMTPVEAEVRGKDFIAYGKNNDYPDYLFGLYNEAATLSTIINGTVDYIKGNKVVCNVDGFGGGKEMNRKGETISDIVEKAASDYLIQGGFYLQIVRNRNKQVAEIYWLDYRAVRQNENGDVFFYSKDWSKSYGRVKYIVLPKFDPKNPEQETGVIFIKTPQSRNLYGTPLWNAAIKDAEIEKNIDEYHLNALNNGFAGSYIVNFNGGKPEDELKKQIEKSINEKFAGYKNAARILVSFNDDEEHKTTIEKLETEDFGEKYHSLEKRSKSQIFCSFRATPNLFGLPTETTGFNEQEYEGAFKLFNRTMVRPIQQLFSDTFDYIFQVEESISIDPFSLVENETISDTEKTVE